MTSKCQFDWIKLFKRYEDEVHGMVEELLKLLIDKVDADLFERVEFENFESSNVQHADEGDLLHCGVDPGKTKRFQRKIT